MLRRRVDGALDDLLQAGGDARRIRPEIDRVAVQRQTLPAGEDEVKQFAGLVHIALAADALRRGLVPFQEDGIAPVDYLELVTVPIPEEMLGVNVVVDDLMLVRGGQQVEQAVDDDQHLQLREPLVGLGQLQNLLFEHHPLSALQDDIEMGLPADMESAFVQQFYEDRVAFELEQRAPLGTDVDFLTGPNRRRIVRRRTLDHHRAVVLVGVKCAQNFAAATTGVDMIVAVPAVKQVFSGHAHTFS